MVFIRQKLLTKRLENFETKSTIFVEFWISKRKWCIILTYKPPKYFKKLFFQELSSTVNKYDKILVAKA